VAPAGHVIEFTFPAPRTVRSVVCRGATGHKWEEDFPINMEVSADGREFRPGVMFTANWDMDDRQAITVACDGATGKVFRFTFKNPWPVGLGEIELSETARVHFAEAKAGRTRSRGHGAERRHHDRYPGPDRGRALASELTVARGAVHNLTAQMAADGRLQWEAPAGSWRIIRLGFTSNGHRVAPATPEGSGLECDKLDDQVVRYHLDQYVGKLIERAGPVAGKTFAAMEVDSWECGIQNWTAGMEQRFRERLGYDLVPFLPTLLEGWIVENADVSERVLWDWRRFLADQFAERYFGVVARWAKDKGLTYVGESTGRQAYLYDVSWIRNSDVTMGEFWLDDGPGQGVRVDNKVASSIAHTTGKRIIASESYTASPGAARWQNHPFSIKALGDRAFCAGVNQFVFHTFAHQPYSAPGPGFTFASWGLNFNRANTWWEVGRAWMEYLTRCNQMLREGQPVADVLWFVGEDVPNRIAWRDELRPVLPGGYDFDGCDAQALLEARVENGRIVLPGGTGYRILLLPHLKTMRPAVLGKVAELARAGATVLGPRPEQSPSLRDLGDGDAVVHRLAGDLWGGHVASGISFEELFQRINLPPDFDWKAAASDAAVLYVHRRTADADIYFLSNQRCRREDLTATFRVGDRAPELWDPATGEITRPGVFRVAAGRTELPLRLEPNGSVFVVFRGPLPARHGVAMEPGPAAPAIEIERTTDGGMSARCWKSGPATLVFSEGSRAAIEAAAVPEPLVVTGPWQVTFPPNLGAPAAVQLNELGSLSEHTEPGIRHFSGTATYRATCEAPRFATEGLQTFLDLGDVQVIAEVRLNGRDLGILWKPPFRIDVSGVLKPGANELEVRVTTLWPNRMIGDAALPDDVTWKSDRRNLSYPANWPEWLVQGAPRTSGRVTFCTRKGVYEKDEPLLPSGLLGPVRLVPALVVPIGK
jgi:hypothetical protein